MFRPSSTNHRFFQLRTKCPCFAIHPSTRTGASYGSSPSPPPSSKSNPSAAATAGASTFTTSDHAFRSAQSSGVAPSLSIISGLHDANSSTFTASVCPHRAARHKADAPSSFTQSRSDPAATSFFIASTWPYAAARCSAVLPAAEHTSIWVGSTFSSSSITSRCPSAAAHRNAVRPP